MLYREVNFDGLVGPSHNYAGLAKGNLASQLNSKHTSYPKQAALQGLAKMKLLHSLGVPQAFLPPHQRPELSALRKLGFRGKTKRLIAKCAQEAPQLLAAAYSSSAMWTANCATISPSSNTRDNRLHLTPANLCGNFHRSLEADFSYKLLKTIFPSKNFFNIHSPLPSCDDFSDEGAANHMSLFSSQSKKSLELFVYGKSRQSIRTKVFAARQNLMASQAIIRRHNIFEGQSLILEQNPEVIDQGVFHNDVICTSHNNFLLTHEKAFANQKDLLKALKLNFSNLTGEELIVREITERELTVKEAVKTYLFNSQIVSDRNNKMTLIAPQECQDSQQTESIINNMISSSENPLQKVHFINLKQSMSNGGGPACLRLRVTMNDLERQHMNQNFFLNDKLFKQLESWIQKHYRDEISPKDLEDPLLHDEILLALDELTKIIKTPKLYPFQN